MEAAVAEAAQSGMDVGDDLRSNSPEFAHRLADLRRSDGVNRMPGLTGAMSAPGQP